MRYRKRQRKMSTSSIEISTKNGDSAKKLLQDVNDIFKKIHESNRTYRRSLKIMLAEERILEWSLQHIIHQDTKNNKE